MNQEKKVLEQINFYGYVSRNWALKNYISRLSAIIYHFKKDGMKFQGKWIKTDYGKDYRYYLVEELTQDKLI